MNTKQPIMSALIQTEIHFQAYLCVDYVIDTSLEVKYANEQEAGFVEL